MAPLHPHWAQPSHPEIQEVIINEKEFTSKSISKVDVPPFGLYAKMAFPPCTLADEPTYATVQFDKDKHLNLNSDLLYINHSCEPSLIFDTANFRIIAGPNGLQAGEELTFFYPSTEWHMAQPFDCLCGKPTCRGRIAGARDMPKEKLEGLWINGHIRELLEQQAVEAVESSENGDHHVKTGSETAVPEDPTAQALRDALKHAEKIVEAAQAALRSYMSSPASQAGGGNSSSSNSALGLPHGSVTGATESPNGLARRGPTSRELSGEMGGDTTVA
ncbi:hypothetical protein BX600DRAFT_451306 [Xylariales sp. PMI_506]|nr:hypothetical protein BX600DRAFT_451306 [Xylariales sp. PMI_506]